MFNIWITVKKSAVGFLTGLAAVVVLSISQGIASYNPVVCTAEITENCTPSFVVSLWLGIIPVVTGFLVGVANWLKNKDNK
jgi:hypothetical protein